MRNRFKRYCLMSGFSRAPLLACAGLISLLFPLVDPTSVTDAVNDDQTFFANDFIDYAVVALAQLE